MEQKFCGEKTCQGCQRDWHNKFKEKKRFDLSCNLIKIEQIPKEILLQLPEEHKKIAETSIDIIKWASYHFKDPSPSNVALPRDMQKPWMPRIASNIDPKRYPKYAHLSGCHYQETMLRCTSKLRVSRTGRRTGKCLAEGTLVMTPRGSIAIEQLSPGDDVYGYNSDGSVSITQVVALWDQGTKDVVDLINHGKVIATSTMDHRWLFDSENWSPRRREVKSLKDVGHGYYVAREFCNTPGGKIDFPYAYTYGVLLGDGCSRDHGVAISTSDKVVLDIMHREIGGFIKSPVAKNFTWHFNGVNKKKLPYYLDWIDGKYAHQKYFDLDIVRTWNRSSQLRFISGLLDSDGSLDTSDGCLHIRWTFQSRKLIENLRKLILDLWQYDAVLYKDKREKYKNGPVYTLAIKNNLFVKRILKDLSLFTQCDRKKWRPEHEGFVENNTNPKYVGFTLGKPYKKQCWDITVTNDTNLYLLANGLITHNTTCMAIDMLFHCFTARARCLLIAPRKSHVEDVFTRIRQFISMRPELQNSVVRDVSSPFFELKFANGARIRGFTSGASSGSDAVTARGQDADRIYLDEADYLSEGDLSAIIPIVFTHKDVTLWASSTPKGSRGAFWNWCTQNPSFKEFHFPSMVIPEWEQVEHEIADLYRGRKADFEHEVLAEFGEEKQGVYEAVLVEAAKDNYRYEDCKPEPGYRYVMGIDWNSSDVGTEIYVLAFSPSQLTSQVVCNVCVSKLNWTQTLAMGVIRDLNRKWEPDWIYCDEGYGTTQIEFLKKLGYESVVRDSHDPDGAMKQIDARLKDIVKGINFSSNIEIRDPFTGAPVEKPMKPYLVNNSVRIMEERRIKFSSQDMDLEKQMLGYRIGRWSVNGRPTYEQAEESTGDHKLDAFNLALLALTQEYTALGRPLMVSNIAFAGSFGQPDSTKTPIDQFKEFEKKRETQRPQARWPSVQSQSIIGKPHHVGLDRSRLPIWRHPDFSNEKSDGFTSRQYAGKNYSGRSPGSSIRRFNSPRRNKF